MVKKIKIGIVGCGTIAGEIVKASKRGALRGKVVITALYDKVEQNGRRLEKYLGVKCLKGSIVELMESVDLVIEAAAPSVSGTLLEMAVRKKKDIMIMSTGGLLGYIGALKEADRKGVRVFIPSGAVAGIDALKAGALSGIKSVTITTRKPPKGLIGAPYLMERNIKLDKIKKEKIVFDGNAVSAVKAFPKNINVSAVLSLAGIGAEKTRVRIVACPGAARNTHEVEIKGDFGAVRTITENVPSPDNPKTSYLAALSAIATLKNIVESVRIGT